MQHDIESYRPLRVVVLRHDEAVRLPGAVDPRHIPENRRAAPLRPGAAALGERRHTLRATPQGPFELPHVVGGELMVIPQGPFHPLGEDRRIGEITGARRFGSGERVVQRPQTGLEALASVGGQRQRGGLCP